jgi:DNA helicase II / ATP-dependent DNA helicase PcrA
MRLVADLHVHSRHSRATSREADLDGYYRWARVKGIDLVGTGDFTHPKWIDELSSRLVERDGLFVLRDPPARPALEGASPAGREVRFVLTTEISSIYKKHGLVRKVHSLIGVRTLEDARRLAVRLAAIGNIASDGRPILGLDPKDLLSILLEAAPGGFLIPAHIWTPWFSLFGSKSGFDRIEDCFEELTPHIFALETGLSSDPAMNWRWSALDRYRLVSNSDAHSPPNLGREANLLDIEPTWQGLESALRTGRGFLGTVEFYPEEGKYHYDGHRKCGVCMDPEQTVRSGGSCPVCGKPLTVGVLSRVLGLADRGAPLAPRPGESFRSLIPLPEVLAELAGTGSGTRPVAAAYARLIGSFGSEYACLLDAPLEDIEQRHGTLLAEAIRRMREGRTNPTPGYDGEFGVVRVFEPEELARLRGQDELFTVPGRSRPKKRDFREAPDSTRRVPLVPPPAPAEAGMLDADQEAILSSGARRVLVAAGPGSGKTRLLAAWAARTAGPVLALTFTNRAARELSERLGGSRHVTALTFHSFCWTLLQEQEPRLRTILPPADRMTVLEQLFPQAGLFRLQALSERLERAWEGQDEPDPELAQVLESYQDATDGMGAVDVSSLVHRVLQVEIPRAWPAVAVDELQDINRPQYDLLLRLCAGAADVFCIGDPDQAIYGFRGSDRRLFFRFAEETGAVSFSLCRNYRSAAVIVSAAEAVISSGGRSAGIPPLEPVRTEPAARIRVVPCASPSEEGRFIASEIRDLVGGVDSVSVDEVRTRAPGEYSFSEIAVLFRTRAVRDALLPALAEAGLPLHLGVHTPISEEEPFRTVVAALRLSANPDDLVARNILGRRAGLTERVLAAGLAAAASQRGVEAALDLIARTASPIVALDRSVPEIALGEEAIRREAARHGSDLTAFLSRISLCTRESEGPGAPQRVSLLTFHAAKGLEFPAVFIAGAEDGITPLEDERGADPAEERRLFYVAITRARDVLFLSHCRQRARRGALLPSSPSRFLDDIPAGLLEGRERTGKHRADVQLSLF